MGTEYTKQGTCSINLFFKYILFPTDFTGSKINNPGTSSVMLSSPEWVARSNGMSLWAGRCKQTKRGKDEVEEKEAERAGCSDGIVFILVHEGTHARPRMRSHMLEKGAHEMTSISRLC